MLARSWFRRSLAVFGLAALTSVPGRAADASTSEEPPLEIVVEAVRPVRPATEIGLTRERAEQVAGGQGDAVKALQTLPGLARAGVEAEPVVWGSSPRETGLFIDDVPIPFLYYGSGVRSTVPSAWLSTLRLVPGAYDPALGRQLGGVIQLGSSNADVADRELGVSVDTLDAAAVLGTPLGTSSAVRAGGRYGYLGAWLPELMNAAARNLYTIPDYWDTQAQALVDLGDAGMLKLQWLNARESSEREVPAAGLTRAARAHAARGFDRLYLVYERRAPGTATRITPYVGLDTRAERTEMPSGDTGHTENVRLGGLRLDHTQALGPALLLRAGFDAEIARTRAERRGSLSVPAREDDPQLFARPAGRDYVIDEIGVFRLGVAPYADTQLRAGPLTVDAGLRVDTFLIETQRGKPPVGNVPATGTSLMQARLAPRVGGSWELGRSARLFAAASRHYQPPDALDLGAQSGNPTLPPAAATHLLFGEALDLFERVSVEVTLFQKWLEGLATRSDEPSPPPARVLEPVGSGRVFGTQFFVKLRRAHGFSGWLSATLSKSVRRDQPDASERPFAYDQPLVVSAVVNHALDAWNFGARARYASGFVRPSLVSADYDLQEDRYDPVLSEERWWRLPAFFALDLRVERGLFSGSHGTLMSYVELLNLTNRQNPEEVVYSWDYRERNYLSSPPLVVVLGARWSR